MLVGYMRVSTDGGDRQVLDLQRDGLLDAGVDERHLIEDRASGSRDDRAGLGKALAFTRAGDCLVVWKLDRLGRSLPHLLTTVTGTEASAALRIPTRCTASSIDTTTPQGEPLYPHASGRLRSMNGRLIQEVACRRLAAAKACARGNRVVAADHRRRRWRDRPRGADDHMNAALDSRRDQGGGYGIADLQAFGAARFWINSLRHRHAKQVQAWLNGSAGPRIKCAQCCLRARSDRTRNLAHAPPRPGPSLKCGGEIDIGPSPSPPPVIARPPHGTRPPTPHTETRLIVFLYPLLDKPAHFIDHACAFEGTGRLEFGMQLRRQVDRQPRHLSCRTLGPKCCLGHRALLRAAHPLVELGARRC